MEHVKLNEDSLQRNERGFGCVAFCFLRRASFITSGLVAIAVSTTTTAATSVASIIISAAVPTTTSARSTSVIVPAAVATASTTRSIASSSRRATIATSVIVTSSVSAASTRAAAVSTSSAAIASTIIVASTVSTATAAVASATTTVATSVISTTTTAAAAALGLRFVDAQGSSVHFVTIEFFARLLGRRRRHGDKTKAAGFARIAIRRHKGILDLSVLFKDLTDHFRLRVKTEISHVEFDFGFAAGIESTGPAGAQAFSATATGRTAALGTRFVDANGATVQLDLIELGNGRFGAGPRFHRDKAESAGTIGAAFDG
mmetsp:Transcript_12789/g.30860  ORF Transcript_12789/g.30860 Transcript_12789/m.30860 type:complete len:317 (-) Transcript_12789:378-1328(-)